MAVTTTETISESATPAPRFRMKELTPTAAEPPKTRARMPTISDWGLTNHLRGRIGVGGMRGTATPAVEGPRGGRGRGGYQRVDAASSSQRKVETTPIATIAAKGIRRLRRSSR